MSNYALIKNDIVENIVLWDGSGDLFSEYITVNIDDITCGIGWSYSDGAFTAHELPPVIKSPDEMVNEANQQKIALISHSTSKIIVWQTKLLAGRALTSAESAQLNAWLDYIDALEAVDTSKVPDITWPIAP